MALQARSASLSQLIQEQSANIKAAAPVISRALSDTSLARARAGSGGTGILTGILDILGDPAGTPKAESTLAKQADAKGGVVPQPTPNQPTALTTPSKRTQPSQVASTTQLTPEQRQRLGLFG